MGAKRACILKKIRYVYCHRLKKMYKETFDKKASSSSSKLVAKTASPHLGEPPKRKGY